MTNTIRFRRPVKFTRGHYIGLDAARTREAFDDDVSTEDYARSIEIPAFGEISPHSFSHYTAELLRHAHEPLGAFAKWGGEPVKRPWWYRRWMFWWKDHVWLAFVFFFKILRNGADDEVYYR